MRTESHGGRVDAEVVGEDDVGALLHQRADAFGVLQIFGR